MNYGLCTDVWILDVSWTVSQYNIMRLFGSPGQRVILWLKYCRSSLLHTSRLWVHFTSSPSNEPFIIRAPLIGDVHSSTIAQSARIGAILYCAAKRKLHFFLESLFMALEGRALW